MQVVKYNKSVQKALNSKTKPEPWLHCAIQAMRLTDGRHDELIAESKGAAKRRLFPLYYVIYVWDTRKVLEAGVVRGDVKIPRTSTKDNGKKLKGGSGVDKTILNIFNGEQTFQR